MPDEFSPDDAQPGGEPPLPGRDDYRAALLLRASRAFADRPVAEAAFKVRAIVGVPKIPEAEVAAQAAWDKLRRGQVPLATELAALELVIRMMRPAPLSKNGDLEALKPNAYNPGIEAAWNGFRARVRPFLYSIGRLDRTAGADPAVGTGFLVGPSLVLTNHHVVTELSLGTDALDPGQAVISFNQEFGRPDPESSRFAVERIEALHSRLDLALLRIAPAGARPVPPLARDPAAPGTDIAAIGYPYKDGRNPLFVSAIYGSGFGVKRAALGQVTSGAGARLSHDCSTLGGNSGSPLFSLATGEVVGVHYSGQFMYRNDAVPAAEVATFIAQAGG